MSFFDGRPHVAVPMQKGLTMVMSSRFTLVALTIGGGFKWAYAAGGAYALLMVLFFAWPKSTPANGDGLEKASWEQPLLKEKMPKAGSAKKEENVLQFDSGNGEEKTPSQPTEF